MRETRAEQCGYQVREAFGQHRFCAQPARWIVRYTTPDDGKAMRTRAVAIRCWWHRGVECLPKGATQVTTESLDYERVFAAAPARPRDRDP